MEKNQENLKIAGKHYKVEDYTKSDQASSGLATTHEQVSDAYMEGEINAVVDDVNRKDVEIPRKGFER